MTQPLAGNQYFSNVAYVADQLSDLSVGKAVTSAQLTANGLHIESLLMDPQDTLFNHENPDPNQGPYATPQWPIGTVLTRGINQYVFCLSYAGSGAYAGQNQVAHRVYTGGAAIDQVAVTFPSPALKGATTLVLSFIWPNLALNSLKGGTLIFTSPTPGSGTSGSYEITSNTAGTSSATAQAFTLTLGSPLNANTADTTGTPNAELMWDQFGVWPAQSTHRPFCVSLVTTTPTHRYAWFQTKGKACVDVYVTSSISAIGLPRMNAPTLGDQMYVLETGTAAVPETYSVADTGKVCTIPSPLIDVLFSGVYPTLAVTPGMTFLQPQGVAAGAATNVFEGKVWSPITNSLGVPVTGAGQAQRMQVMQSQGLVTEKVSCWINSTAATSQTVSLAQDNARPPVGMCKSRSVPQTAGTHQCIIAIDLQN